MGDFFSNNAGLLGAGAGLLPTLLLHLFGQGGGGNQDFGGGNGTTGSVINGQNLQIPDQSTTHGYAGGDPTNGITNYTVSPGMGIADQTQGSQNNSATNKLGGLTGLMSALNAPATSTPGGTPVQQQQQPMMLHTPNYGGTGATSATPLGRVNQQSGASAAGNMASLANSPVAPTGPAALNPMLALSLLRSHFGIA